MFDGVKEWFSPSPRQSLAMANPAQADFLSKEVVAGPSQPLRRKDKDMETKKRHNSCQIENLKQKIQELQRGLEKSNSDNAAMRQLYHHQHTQENDVNELKNRIQTVESERDLILRKYEESMLQQQKKSFQQMETGKWLPEDESQVASRLERMKRQMRSWAKEASTSSTPIIEELGGEEFLALMEALSHVVVIVDNQLPPGLGSPKAPSLLLNALVAHDVYRTFFRSPFFFLDDGYEGNGADTLLWLYHQIQNCKWPSQEMSKALTIVAEQQGAEVWRSQLLRLLLPPLRSSTSVRQEHLRNGTELLILKAAAHHASRFMAEAAGNLITKDEVKKRESGQKLQAIYHDAALLSYKLWTRKVALRCTTLKDLKNPTFDPQSQSFQPHSLVRPDKYEDQLLGRPISVMVHPLLEAFGTDEGEDYLEGRVWAAGVVWLDETQYVS